ncbi:probable serine/threonine-protein kinase PBL21 [Typha angustifolia]|uniref:probable serine/threonine-protein kinase PBL21 n=1 Tax=Typha angustifolia TaxID=59011 RepID=UPI003C2E79C2
MGSSLSGSCSSSCCITSKDGKEVISLKTCRKLALGKLTQMGGGSGGEREGRHEENKSWLLAGSVAGDAGADPHSVHSSFRFSFGSQTDAEDGGGGGGGTGASASAVLLLVSLGDGGGGGERKEQRQWKKLEFLERSIAPVAAGLVRFSYAEIRAATRGLRRGRELGRGALSRVYRGTIGLRRRAVAVKKVEGEDRESAKAFCRELMIASSLCNPNIVPLIGFCVDKEGLFLVYKFVSGGSLDQHLHHHERRGRRKVLPWKVRYKVAIGLARAVEYLHYATDKCVIHRDIKPSNILLSAKKSPKLCDFGLATWTHGPSLPFLCKSVTGTFGYLAPEYFQHGKLSDKTDVYAFGVVLLELITGRKAIDRSRPQGDENLVLWAKPLLQQGGGAIEKLVDPLMKLDSICWSEMRRMVLTATACISNEESERPNINQVISMLQDEDTCGDWSIFTGNGCLTGYSSHLYDPLERGNMRSHLALAMLGVSDTDEDDKHTYGH